MATHLVGPMEGPGSRDPAAIEVGGVSKSYRRRRVLDDVSFAVPAGSALAVTGALDWKVAAQQVRSTGGNSKSAVSCWAPNKACARCRAGGRAASGIEAGYA
ncbi:MAG: hypothetical protein LBH68_06110 [Bifidobacteriaceae bacterium]|jgi:hypothetical protein|nr:hypothetical protein [Bifidobacteriaceae bacterium]